MSVNESVIERLCMFVCPVCGGKFTAESHCLRCQTGHSFDIAKRGYVNLLMKQHAGSGDDAIMVRARREFLNSGRYLPLRNAISAILAENLPNDGVFLDAGCGEGWYAEGFRDALPNAKILGVDISKEAVDHAARRPGMGFAVGSVFRLPIADHSVDAVVSVFSPFCASEFERVLKPGGKAVAVVPLPRHLFALKAAVYEHPYENDDVRPDAGNLKQISEKTVKFVMKLQKNEEIASLFAMTPYYYKTADSDREKLQKVETLDVEAEFLIITYESVVKNNF